ncbi:MAG TPA: hypothetical protein VMD59_00740, partial [Acidimicrobiales bacterium]|nr:hypothetical protein [Acidimicrobiales bacterium]
SKNRAIRAACGEYIFTGEDDLEIVPGFFRTLLAHRDRLGVDLVSPRDIWRHPGESAESALARAAMATGRYVDTRRIAIKPELDTGDDVRVLLAPNPMLGPADIFKRIGFDEAYGGNSWREETDFQLSVQEAGYSIGLCPHATAFNCMIEHDRGGSHAAVGLRRVRWQLVNTWRLLSKHDRFLAERFDIGMPRLFMVRFAVRRAAMELVVPAMLPRLSRAKRALSRLLAHRTRASKGARRPRMRA